MPSLLDLILSTEEGMVHNLVHNPGLGDSDHECLAFDLNCYKEDCKDTRMPNYARADFVTIRNRIKDVDWMTMLKGKFLDDYSKFELVVADAMTGCVPSKGKGKKRKNIYLTSEAVKMKDRKNNLWR